MSCCTPTNPSGASGLSGRVARLRADYLASKPNISASRVLADWETFRELVPHLDLFLYDIKHMDRPTGGSRARAAGGFWTACACCSAWAKRF